VWQIDDTSFGIAASMPVISNEASSWHFAVLPGAYRKFSALS
jgi:hypothetical protein